MGLREKTGLHRRMLYYLVVGVIVGASLLKPSKGGTNRMKRISRELSFPQGNPLWMAYEQVGYAAASGQEMIRIRYQEMDCDIFDDYGVALSSDNGKTWTEHESWAMGKRSAAGTQRAMWTIGLPDPRTGRLVITGKVGVFPNDNSLEGMTHFRGYYRVSEDAGRTWSVYEPIIQSGEEYSENHPCRGVHVGKNAAIPANAEIFTADGRLLVPCNVSTVGPDGNYFLPPGAYTHTAGGVLIGTWRDDGHMDWDFSELVRLGPEQSLRGAIEPTLAEMPDGRILMVLRADAGTSPEHAVRHKWYSVSADGGHTWAEPRPWTYTDGALFYSPSSISRLIRHSNGTWYWIGNISEKKLGVHPDGNAPRYPLVIGRVDPNSLLLDKDSLFTIDTRGDEDPPSLQLSNFTVYEDRLTGEFVLRLTRWDGVAAWHTNQPTDASVYRYRVEL